MKKFINNIEDVENEMIEGIILAYPELLERLENTDVIVRKNKKKDKVALVSGGGSGHEPAHIGYVGEGMLDAAVPGAIYTSPTPDQIYQAIKAVDTGKGVLLIVKNYTGDVMNFEMAADIARDEGIDVEEVIVKDDIAVPEESEVGRRGVAGTVFVHKIAGAKAEEGASLEEVKEVAEKVSDNLRTMGVAIKPSTIPAVGVPGFDLAEDEMEVGIGIHGEPGVSREKLKPVNEIIEELTDRILADKDFKGKEVALLINGSGATPQMELYIAARKAIEKLMEEDIKVGKTLVGNYMTSIDQAGLSVTLLELDDELKDLLDAPADTVAMTLREKLNS